MHSPECPFGDQVLEVVDSPEAASAAFDLLSDYHRRLLLHCLRDHATEPVELAVVLSAWVERRPDEVAPSEASLDAHHVHLPKLVETGVVDYDRAGGTIRYTGDPILDACLDGLRDLDLES